MLINHNTYISKCINSWLWHYRYIMDFTKFWMHSENEFPVSALCSLEESIKVEPILVQPTYCTELHKTSGLECISWRGVEPAEPGSGSGLTLGPGSRSCPLCCLASPSVKMEPPSVKTKENDIWMKYNWTSQTWYIPTTFVCVFTLNILKPQI